MGEKRPCHDCGNMCGCPSRSSEHKPGCYHAAPPHSGPTPEHIARSQGWMAALEWLTSEAAVVMKYHGGSEALAEWLATQDTTDSA